MIYRLLPLAAALFVAGCLSAPNPDAPIDISTMLAAMTDNRGMIIASLPSPGGDLYIKRVENGELVSAKLHDTKTSYFHLPTFDPVYVVDAGNYEIRGYGYPNRSSYHFDSGFFESELDKVKQRLNSPSFVVAPSEIKHIGLVEMVEIPGTYQRMKKSSLYRMAIRDLTEEEKASVRRRYPTISDRIKFEKAKDSVLNEILCKMKPAEAKARANVGAKAENARSKPGDLKPLPRRDAKAEALLAELCVSR
ncbi:MAG: hypothetical protein ACK4HD_01135 [Pannonibacter phragmitetus]